MDDKTKQELLKSLDRKSVVQGKSVDLGGRRIIKKKKNKKKTKKRKKEKKQIQSKPIRTNAHQ